MINNSSSKAQSNQHTQTEKELLLSIENKIKPFDLKRLDEDIPSLLDYVESLKEDFKVSEETAKEAINQFPDPIIFYQTDPTFEFINIVQRLSLIHI